VGHRAAIQGRIGAVQHSVELTVQSGIRPVGRFAALQFNMVVGIMVAQEDGKFGHAGPHGDTTHGHLVILPGAISNEGFQLAAHVQESIGSLDNAVARFCPPSAHQAVLGRRKIVAVKQVGLMPQAAAQVGGRSGLGWDRGEGGWRLGCYWQRSRGRIVAVGGWVRTGVSLGSVVAEGAASSGPVLMVRVTFSLQVARTVPAGRSWNITKPFGMLALVAARESIFT